MITAEVVGEQERRPHRVWVREDRDAVEVREFQNRTW
jgi:hypothetical protein